MVRISLIALFLVAIGGFLLTSTSEVVKPFIIAFILAYALNPFLKALQNKTPLPRSLLAVVVLLTFLTVFAWLIMLLIPIIYSQISLLVAKIPVYKSYVTNSLVPYVMQKIHSLDPAIASNIQDTINKEINSAFAVLISVLHNIWTYTMATISALVMLFLIPVLLFYFLRDWEKMKINFYQLFPKKSQEFVRGVFSDIDKVLAGYLRGQLLVCAIWIVYYYTGLRIIGLDIALILALISGFVPIVPLIGPLVAVTTSMLVGYLTFGLSIELTYIAGLYMVGNILDSSIVAPKIIGDSIGLSPIWIMFSVLILGFLLGPIGMLIAIPVAGIVSVILKHARRDYNKSDLYNK